MAPVLHADGLHRCPWPGQDPFYVAYHDDEWGVPEYDDRALYEKLMLDGFQAGLSWITILRKRVVPVTFADFGPEAGVPVWVGETSAGVMGSSANGRGLAMLHLSRVGDALAAGTPIMSGGIALHPTKPAWARFDWPGEAKAE